jgi:hypothetical protein
MSVGLSQPNTDRYNWTILSGNPSAIELIINAQSNTDRFNWYFLKESTEPIYINTSNNYDNFKVDKSTVENDRECSICLCNLCDNDDKLVSCPSCKNIFHRECKRGWLSHSEHKNCPLCRSTVWTSYNM